MRPIFELKRELCALPFYQTDSILYSASVEQACKACLDAIYKSPVGIIKFMLKHRQGCALISHLLQTTHLRWVGIAMYQGDAGAKCLSGLESALMVFG